MYEYLEGQLAGQTPQHAILDVVGIGYRIAISAADGAKLPPRGENCRLYTTFIVRENEQTLYGFLESANRELFETLTTISGIGPKTALAILGSLTLELLQRAILEGDPKLLSKVPGIGKKTAERLLMELKDGLPTSLSILPQGVRPSGQVEDAIQALINLGYSRLRAQKALQKPLEEMGEGADLATLITAALQKI